MNKAKRSRLKKAGYRVTDTKHFLGLTDVENALIELKIALMERLKNVRAERQISQTELAKRVGSSQSRIAKIEGASRDITLDLICRALLALGESPKTIGKTIARAI